MRRATFGQMHCSIARALDVVGDTWTPLILRDLFVGLHRFEDLVVDLGISRNLLASRLEHLVASGVVARREYQARPPRDSYVLTEAGRELAPVLIALTTWGDTWAPTAAGPPLRFRHECGELVTPILTCPRCAGLVDADTTVPEAGPGGRSAPGTALVGTTVTQGGVDSVGGI